MRFLIFQDTQRGARANNEDRVGYFYTRDALLMVVADGMGGHNQGEVAAEIAIEVLSKRFQNEAKPTLQHPRQFLRDAFFNAHDAIMEYGTGRKLPESPRTTCVACVVQDGKAYWAHAGDSRLLYFRAGKLAQRTKDHSYVGKLLAMGALREDQIAGHPARNRIFSCLGGNVLPQIELSEEIALTRGDTILLATDGFWEPITTGRIEIALAQSSIVDCLPSLVTAAIAQSGERADNTSIVAMTWDPPGNNDPQMISTIDMDAKGFSSAVLSNLPETIGQASQISDAEIDKAIAEIQTAIKRKPV
jgi:serine/threonine protein phosphatase PrpC